MDSFGCSSTPGSTRPMTFEIGYALSAEEHPPTELVRCAVRAEETGFSFFEEENAFIK